MSNTNNDSIVKPSIGPFTKENFDQPKWKRNRERIYHLNSTNEEETLPDVKYFLQFLHELNASQDYNQYFGETSIRNYFFEDLLPANAKNLIGCKFFNNEELLDLSNQCFDQMILFWFKTLDEDFPKLADMAKTILDPSRAYYKYNNQENVSSTTVPGFLDKPTAEHLAWVESIQEGQLIDCIKMESTYKKAVWSQAKVSYVMDAYIKVQFINDYEKAGRYIEKKSNIHEIAPLGTKCHDFDWRMNLQVGDEIDAYDTSRVWYNSTVLATREMVEDDNTIKEVKIGYRVYSPEGDKHDADGKRFFGWSAKYDEWFTVTSPRLDKKNSMAKKLHLTSSQEEATVDDSNDRVYDPTGEKKIYAVIRTEYCKSTFLINLVNKFGHMGGFDRIYNRITNKTNWAPIETVSQLIAITGNMSNIFYRNFALEYIPKLRAAVWKNLCESPDSNIRNFTKERIEHIVTGFDVMLKRIYSLPEKQEMLETLNLQICSVCFDSQFLERKLQGLKTLLQIIKEIRTSSSSARFMTNSQLNSFLFKNDIFNKIFGPKGHMQLLQRSADFLKYMFSEDILGLEDFQSIWSGSTKGDMETKLAVYKVISDVSLSLKEIHLEFLINKISEINPHDVIPEEIDLIYEMCRFSIKPAWFIKKARQFYWSIIKNVDNAYATNIVEQTLTRFCDIMRGGDHKEERINVLYECVENIQKEISVLSSLKIMKKLIENLPVSPVSSESFTKGSCLEHLCKEKGLLNALVDDLKLFKSNIKKKAVNLKKIDEEGLNSLVNEKVSYITHITERLNFIYYLLTNNSGDITLTYELLSELWDVIVNNALVASERDVIYKWIKEIAESKSGFPMNIEDLKRFFAEMMKGNANQESQRMTKEGFKCFKNVFLVINEKLTKITKVTTPTTSSGYSSYVGYSSSSYSPYSSMKREEEKKKEKNFGYRVNVFPKELEGISSIWDFILIAEENKVAEKAIDFLNKLYLHVNTDLEAKIIEIREEYLYTCNVHLKETLAAQSSLSETAFTNRCLRCLNLISSIMDESEKKGIGNMRSNSGLVKGELFTLTIINDLSYTADVPKKTDIRVHSNTTMFELRVKIAKLFKATWDQVKLTRRLDSKDIKDNENGRTVREMRMKNAETITASKRPTPPIPQVSLLQGDDTIHPDAEKIFVGWFHHFGKNDRMNPEQCAAFIHSCTGDYCKADDKRVKDVFQLYDDDRDGFLTIENFLKFYYSACKQRPQVVWSNLHSHHYRNDLKKVTEVEQEKINITSLARYIISTNNEYSDLLFSLLDLGGKIATEAWKLLNRIPTNPHIFSDIVMLKGVREAEDPSKRDWNHILDMNSKYKLLYALNVMEYLMEDDEAELDEGEEEEEESSSNNNNNNESSSSHFAWSKDSKLLEYKKNWQADFIFYGGFDHLFKIFNSYADQKSNKKLNIFDKNVLSFILKILKNYVTATFAAKIPHIYRNLSFIRLFYLSLEYIQDYIKNESLSRKNSKAIQDSQEAPAAEPEKPKNDAEGAKVARKDSKAEEKKKEKSKIEETEEFKALVERLNGDLGSQILATINLKDLLEVVSTLGYNTLFDTSGDLESEDRMVLEYSLTILMAILLYDESYVQYFLNLEKDPQGHQGADKFMLEGIFYSKSITIRKQFSHAIYVLCKHTKNFKNGLVSKYFIGLFLNNLPSSDDENRKDCNQYFEILCKLIEETYLTDNSKQQRIEDDTLDFKGLLQKVVERLRAHESTEKRNNLNATDKVLMGLLNLCEKIITVQPQLRDLLDSGSQENNIVQEIFNVCLFNVETGSQENGIVAVHDEKREYVKCKSRDSRSFAYKLLIALCRGHESNMTLLLECIKNLTTKILQVNTKTGWGYSPSSDTKSIYGYVGIKNLGCICYMNAMLQQFFMTPTFRYAILAADDKKEPNWVQHNKLKVDDNVLHQLQKMFGFLEMSDRQDYNPQEFCFAFKDYAGQPVNVSVQQDTQEFLNTIFDKLEHGLKHTPFQHILESVYGGKTSNQVICHGCGNVREREDIFYNLSVEVKNLKTVYESFDKFITGETIDDYNCENCKQKNSITKRTCLSELPNVMIIHLQRIVFDLDTLMNQKINSKLEFPTELNLEPYTKEGLEWREESKKQKKHGKKDAGNAESLKVEKKETSEGKETKDDFEDEEEEEIDTGNGDEKEASGKKPKKKKKQEVNADQQLGPYMKHEKDYYEYRLAGVVVHVGTADFGHYYSYINTNRGDLKGEGGQKADRWLEYNDSQIKDFNLKDLEAECFGGAGGESVEDSWSFSKVGREYSKNAYILVYERVVKNPLKLVVRNEEDKEYLNKILKTEKTAADGIPENVRVEKVEVGEGENKQTLENYYCNYFQIGKSILPRVTQSTWEDNHKFMFERHIYTEDFFKFIKEVCATFQLPDEVVAEPVVNFINPKHTAVSPQVKQNLSGIIKIIAELILYLLARAHDNNTITELTEKLKQLLSVNPEAAFPLFSSLIGQDYKNILELFLNCPEKQVRHCTSQAVLYMINVAISYHNIDLTPEFNQREPKAEESKEKENIRVSIISFLDSLRAHMPTEVAKNWLKFQQYFEFWRDFSYSGETQVQYLFKHSFISVLIDFYLGSKSPIPDLSEKKHTMGNRYAEPEFNPLLQTVSNLVQRSHVDTLSGEPPYTSILRKGGNVTYSLSQNDFVCLCCGEFYEKTMKEKFDYHALGVIIQHFSFENETFSLFVAEIILKGLNRSNFEEARPYLEALSYFVSIGDFIQMKRFEWIFGYPLPIVSSLRSEPESFGTFGNSSLEELVISYETPLAIENGTSLLNLILQSRKKIDNLCLVSIKQLLILLDLNQNIFQYVTSLPPPSYNFAKFTDFIPQFIDYFIADAKKYVYSSHTKEEMAIEAQKLWKPVEEKLKSCVDTAHHAWIEAFAKIKEVQGNTESAAEDVQVIVEKAVEGENSESANKKHPELPWIVKPYVIGQTVNEVELDKRIYSSENSPQEVTLTSSESFCYITESKPTGHANHAFPDFVMHGMKFRNVEVNTESPLSLFIQPRAAYEAGKVTMNTYIEKGLKDKTTATSYIKPQPKEEKLPENAQPIQPLFNDLESGTQTQPREQQQHPVVIAGGSSGQAETDVAAKAGDLLDDEGNNESQGQPLEEEAPIQAIERNGQLELERVVPSPEDFTFNYELNPMIRRFIVNNPTLTPMICHIRLIPKTGEFMNFRVPLSTFKTKVKGHSHATVLSLMKILPEVGWGQYDVECEIHKADGPAGSKYDNDDDKKRQLKLSHYISIRPDDNGMNF